MRSSHRTALLSFLLAGLPALVGCSRDFWDRSPRVMGEVERVPAGAPASPRSLSSADLPPPATVRSAPAVQPTPTYERNPVLSGSPDGQAPVAPALLVASGSEAPTSEDLAVLTEVNRLRSLHSLPALRFDARLFRAARAHSTEQMNGNYLGHGSPDPERAKLSQRINAAGFTGRMYAEVVASNYVDVGSVVDAWMQSPTHRVVLLDPDLSEGAFSRVSLSADTRLNRWTGDFGAPTLDRAVATPAPASPPVNPAPRSQAGPVQPAPVRAGIPATATPRSQPALPAPRATALPVGRSNGELSPGGKLGVPAPAFGSSSGDLLPPPALAAPRAAVVQPSAPAPAPSTYVPRPPQPYVQPYTQPYVAPAPVPYQPQPYVRRPARRVGDCAT